MKRAEVFRDPDVSRAYRYRPGYPAETFELLGRIMVEPRIVLDVGAGSGAIARDLLAHAQRVDAVDPSLAMIAEGRRLPHGDDPRLRWIVGTAEDAPLDPPYGLITAGASLHWMDLARVIPRFADALAPGGKLAVLEVVDTPVGSAPWRAAADAVIRKYSELDVPVVDTTGDVLTELRTRELWVQEGDELTAPVRTETTIDHWLEWMHSTSTHARIRLGIRAPLFDRNIRELFAGLGMSRLEFAVQGRVAWGSLVSA